MKKILMKKILMNRFFLLLPVLLLACHISKASPDMASPILTIGNSTPGNDTIYIAFGSDSTIKGWPNCTVTTPGTCTVNVPAGSAVRLPIPRYLNATLSFNAQVACGVTKAELNVNNPTWYDTVDISLVDGYSNNVQITLDGKRLGPTKGATGNEKVYGVFPVGCDICVARQNPPCGIPKGTNGCKSGTQYKPDVPCQYQGSRKGGGSSVSVTHTP